MESACTLAHPPFERSATSFPFLSLDLSDVLLFPPGLLLALLDRLVSSTDVALSRHLSIIAPLPPPVFAQTILRRCTASYACIHATTLLSDTSCLRRGGVKVLGGGGEKIKKVWLSRSADGRLPPSFLPHIPLLRPFPLPFLLLQVCTHTSKGSTNSRTDRRSGLFTFRFKATVLLSCLSLPPPPSRQAPSNLSSSPQGSPDKDLAHHADAHEGTYSHRTDRQSALMRGSGAESEPVG